jgi:adenine-specific DNA-methyltransferase
MARIEDLIKNIADPALRKQIAAEVAELKKARRFGLVFEGHLPETMVLPGLPVNPGARVQKKGEMGTFYKVTASVNAKKVTIVPESGGVEETLERADLLIVKRFGEPMYPALVAVDSVWRGGLDNPAHVLINADNYHALQLLLYGYEAKVDVIYIDPPYNTGARDWKYNNDYIDRTDQYRHSKWLSMMKKRLVLAKRLLRPDGVLIVTIDEHEVGHLSCLLEMIFPEYLRHMVTAVVNPKGTGKLNFARVDEYLFFCVPDVGASVIDGISASTKNTAQPGEGTLFFPSSLTPSLLPAMESRTAGDIDEGEEDTESNDEPEEDEPEPEEDTQDYPFPLDEVAEWELRHARRRGSESSYRYQRPNQFYPIYVDATAERVVKAGDPIPVGTKPSLNRMDGLIPVWPIDKENNDRCWRFISPKMQILIEARRVRLGRYDAERRTWTLNIWERRPESRKLKTVWWKRAHDAGTHGTTLLHNILGKRASFPFPKSIYAVMDALAAVVRTRPEAIVLDFFSGSGTTLQATCMLNRVFGGTRRCILVTNNEVSEKTAKRLIHAGVEPGTAKYESYGICEAVTWPRIKSVVTGLRPDKQKIPGSYLDGRPMAEGFEESVVYYSLDFLDPSEVSRGEQFEAIVPILWLFAGARGEIVTAKARGKWFIPKGNPFAVLLAEDHFREFRTKLKERTDVTHVFLVTDSPEAFHEMASDLGRKRRCVQLYKSYLDTFTINLEERDAL